MSSGLTVDATTSVAKRQQGGSSASQGIQERRVQGITSDFSDLLLRGQKWSASIGNGFEGGTLTRTVNGASTLVLDIEDPRGTLLRNPLLTEAHLVKLDGLKWVLTKVARSGTLEPLELTYEPLVVYLLRQIMGPHKAFRDLMTRAEFAKALAFMVKPHPIFISPELHVVQAIATAKQGKEAKSEAEISRGEGIGPGANLTVKGVKATSSQLDAGDRALRVAASLGAPRKAKVAMMLALIVESVLGTASSNWYEAEPFVAPNVDHTDLEAMTTRFLQGYNPSEPGAIGEAEAHPTLHAYEITQAVQASGAGESSKGAANYGPWTQEAEEWVEQGPESGAGATGGQETKRYAYSQTAEESNWKALNRLAGEVHWSFFESAGWLYFLAQPSLLKSHSRLHITDSTPAIIDTGFNYDVGREVAEMTVEAMAKGWAAPPGAVVTVSDHGPADGTYIVAQIEAGLEVRDGVVNITLHKPVEPLKEPAPSTVTRTVGGGGTEAGEAPKSVEAVLARAEALGAQGVPYALGGGHGGFSEHPSSLDCSGAVSDALHAGNLLGTPEASTALESYGEAGPGKWITIYANTNHTWMEIEGRPWGTSVGDAGQGGLGFHSSPSASYKAQFTVRHPKNL